MNSVLVGDCFKVLPSLEAESVDLCVTSPPYWGLRDYGEGSTIFGGDPLCEHEWIDTPPPRDRKEADIKNPDSKQATVRGSNYNHKTGGYCEKCGAWKGQLGLEPHPGMFIDHLVELGRLVRDVLKPSGLFWLNLGDTYCTGAGKSISPGGDIDRGIEKIQPPSSPNRMVPLNGKWLQPKQLLMIPSRVACGLQDDGWILRSDVIWSKPNHMPESVTDRFTKSYEHFFMFAKEPRYYFNLNDVRAPHQQSSIERDEQGYHATPMPGRYNVPWEKRDTMLVNPTPTKKSKTYNGKNVGEEIDSEALGSPRARNSRVLKSWGATENGEYNGKSIKNYDGIQEPKEVKKRIIEGLLNNPDRGKNPGDVWEIPTQPFPGSHFAVFPEALVKRIIKCSSPPGGVVLDPFAGSGTTLRVARKLGRRFIGIELNPEYAQMAEERIRGKDFRQDLAGVSPLVEKEVLV